MLITDSMRVAMSECGSIVVHMVYKVTTFEVTEFSVSAPFSSELPVDDGFPVLEPFMLLIFVPRAISEMSFVEEHSLSVFMVII